MQMEFVVTTSVDFVHGVRKVHCRKTMTEADAYAKFNWLLRHEGEAAADRFLTYWCSRQLH